MYHCTVTDAALIGNQASAQNHAEQEPLFVDPKDNNSNKLEKKNLELLIL